MLKKAQHDDFGRLKTLSKGVYLCLCTMETLTVSALLDPRIESDSTFIVNLDLCEVRLNHNAAFPWILLIPKEKGISEIIDLAPSNQPLLMSEIVLASQVMQRLFQPTKLNIASLGNIVPQLHVHIVGRYDTDKAWPHPIWNSGINIAYDPHAKRARIAQLKDGFLNLKHPKAG
jgi:diadenosine tetraphosphate (Ap4A) HIT family hydrolase